MASIDISNCCSECTSATFVYEIVDKERGEHDVTYTIEYYIICDGVQSETQTTQVTLSCQEEECVTINVDLNGCTFEVGLGNNPDCTCEPCAACVVCIADEGFNDELCDELDEDIYATDINITPSSACTGQELVISFTIFNDTGSDWVSIPSGDPGGPDFYLYFTIYSGNGADAGCTDLSFVSSSPAYTRSPSATTVGAIQIFSCDWDINIPNGDSQNFTLTFEVGEICDCSELIAEATVVRGCRKSSDLSCQPCP